MSTIYNASIYYMKWDSVKSNSVLCISSLYHMLCVPQTSIVSSYYLVTCLSTLRRVLQIVQLSLEKLKSSEDKEAKWDLLQLLELIFVICFTQRALTYRLPKFRVRSRRRTRRHIGDRRTREVIIALPSFCSGLCLEFTRGQQCILILDCLKAA